MLLETSPVTRPDLSLRHALRPIRTSRTPLPRGPFLATLAVAVAALIAGLAPASSGPVPLGKISTVAMSRSTLNDRAEWHPDYAKRLGHRMTRDFGYKGTRQWHCLRRTWRLESSWRVHADNRYSRAYGIPQANPGSKMSTAGGHWRRNAETQIRWGLRYVHGRYGYPCVAMRHKNRTGWY